MLIAIAAMTAALSAHPALAQDAPQANPVQPAPTTARALDPATVLRATTSTQAERDEAARRLVQRRNPAARQVLLTALQDVANQSGQLATAKALAADPNPDPAFVSALFSLIGMRADLTDAAISALARYHNDRDVAARLIEFALDGRQAASTRRSAIKAVGHMSDKAAVRALVTIVTTATEPQDVRAAAGNALAEMTDLPAGNDVAQWQQWWANNQNKSDAAFEREILAARAARLSVLEPQFDRIVAAAQAMLGEAYQAMPERSREPMLLRYLRHAEPEVRLVGVELVRQDFNQSRPPSPAAREQLRTMVGDSSARVRATVARVLTLLNDPGAVAAVLEQITQEPDAQVRAELAKTLAPTRDIKVVEPLLGLLKDSSPTVAQVAADALRELGPIIQKDPALARRVAQELREALEARSGGPAPGNPPLRAALIDAMGALQRAELRMIYTNLLRPGEPVPIRRAALRALGKLELPQAAEIIVNSLDDPDDGVRLEAINALDTTANFTQAEKLYSVLKSPQEKPAIRQRAWAVLRNRFPDPSATNDALTRWADRFRDEPERRIEILEVLAQRLVSAKDLRSLAEVQQNIGEAKMKLADAAARGNDPERAQTRAQEADKYFELALAYYRGKDPTDQTMVTSALIEQRMDALLTSRQYSKAADFAASSIASNSGNQEPMGRKLRNEADRLRTDKKYTDAIALIEAVIQMNPKLAEPFFSSIKTIESDVRQRITAGQGTSAIGSGR